jgi:peroxiredoxin
MKKEHLMMAVVLVVVFAAAMYLYTRWQPGKPAAGPGKGAPAPAGTATGGQPAPAFSLTDLRGNAYDSSRMAGKPAVINFFATWCPPCRGEIPGFVEIYNKYKGQGLEVVGIAVDTDTRDKLPAFVEEQKISYPVLLGDVGTAKAYGGISAIPTTFFVGKDGTIRNVHVGFMEKEAFEQEIRKLL